MSALSPNIIFKEPSKNTPMEQETKIELKLEHLAPYLPYSLKVIMEGKKTNVAWMSTKNIAVIRPLGVGEYKKIKWKYAHLNIRPILRPLSDLINDDDTILEIYNQSWIAGRHEIVKTDFEISILSYEDNSKLHIFLSKPHCNMEWINDMLYKKHYDLKGLIDQGLAIDVNTLNQ